MKVLLSCLSKDFLCLRHLLNFILRIFFSLLLVVRLCKSTRMLIVSFAFYFWSATTRRSFFALSEPKRAIRHSMLVASSILRLKSHFFVFCHFPSHCRYNPTGNSLWMSSLKSLKKNLQKQQSFLSMLGVFLSKYNENSLVFNGTNPHFFLIFMIMCF